MEENKNSLLGITEQSSNIGVNAIPFSIALPEDTSQENKQNFVSLAVPEPPNIKTEEQKAPEVEPSVNAVPLPPPLLQKPEEEKPEEIPYLLKRPEPDTTAVPTIPRLKEDNKEQPATANVFGETQPDRVVGQKVKVASTLTETTSKLSENEQKLKNIQEQVDLKKEEIKQKNMASESYLALKPAFENIQNVLDFQRENAKTRDYDDQHYTVPGSQSFFDKTVNQLTDLPYWRGK